MCSWKRGTNSGQKLIAMTRLFSTSLQTSDILRWWDVLTHGDYFNPLEVTPLFSYNIKNIESCHKERYAHCTPSPQKWPSLHKIYAICWNEWKIMYHIFPIFSFSVIVVNDVTIRLQNKIVHKWPNLQERCGLIWQWYFSSWVFFRATLSFRDIINFIYDFFHHLQVFTDQLW